MVSFPKISPNLLLGVGGIIAAVFLVNQIRKAGGDVSKALADIQLPSIGDITFPEIKFPEFKFPDIFVDSTVSSRPDAHLHRRHPIQATDSQTVPDHHLGFLFP